MSRRASTQRDAPAARSHGANDSPRAGWLAAGALVVLAGCGAGAPRRPARQSLRVIPTYWHGDRPPRPAVAAELLGVRTAFVVDTGASEHVVASWLAEVAQLATFGVPDALMLDFAGRAISFRRLQRGAEMTLGDARVSLAGVAVLDNAAFARGEIGGVVSPQQLAAHGGVVVLQLHPLRLVWTGQVAVPRHPGVVALEVCHYPSGGTLYLLATRVSGHPVRLLVDTGSPRSGLYATSTAAGALAGALAEAPGEVSHAGGPRAPLPLEAGGLTLRVPFVRLERTTASPCARDGVLGVDALRSCTLLLAADAGVAACGGP